MAYLFRLRFLLLSGMVSWLVSSQILVLYAQEVVPFTDPPKQAPSVYDPNRPLPLLDFPGTRNKIFPESIEQLAVFDTLPVLEPLPGVLVRYIKRGKSAGKRVYPGYRVTFQYRAYFENGQPVPPGVGFTELSAELAGKQLIKGLEAALLSLPVGSKAWVKIPPLYGYGSEPFGLIPPNTTLYVYVHSTGGYLPTTRTTNHYRASMPLSAGNSIPPNQIQPPPGKTTSKSH